MSLHKSGEDYLEAIYMIQKEKKTVKSIDVAKALNFSRPSVSNAIDILEADGFIIMDENKDLTLTAKGLTIAKKMYARHIFFVDFLKSIGVKDQVAETEGCLMEHILSDDTFSKIKKFIEKK